MYQMEHLAWTVDGSTPYTPNAFLNGILLGYSARENNIIVEEIKLNDNRNKSDYSYRCDTKWDNIFNTK